MHVFFKWMHIELLSRLMSISKLNLTSYYLTQPCFWLIFCQIRSHWTVSSEFSFHAAHIILSCFLSSQYTAHFSKKFKLLNKSWLMRCKFLCHMFMFMYSTAIFVQMIIYPHGQWSKICTPSKIVIFSNTASRRFFNNSVKSMPLWKDSGIKHWLSTPNPLSPSPEHPSCLHNNTHGAFLKFAY